MSNDPGWVSKMLIGINVVAYVLQQTVSGFTSRFYDIGAFPPPPFDAQIGVATASTTGCSPRRSCTAASCTSR